MSGKQVYETLSQRYPELAEKLIFMTGDVLSDEIRQYLTECKKGLYQKTFYDEGTSKTLTTSFCISTLSAAHLAGQLVSFRRIVLRGICRYKKGSTF